MPHESELFILKNEEDKEIFNKGLKKVMKELK